MISFYEKLQQLLLANTPFVCVTMVGAVGSVPQEPGTKMLVTGEGLFTGTIGGGKLENRTLEEAQRLLGSEGKSPSTLLVTWALDRDIGMTCGGSVTLFFEAFNLNPWHIAIFGAGHVAQAVCRHLVNLACRVTVIDPRQAWLDRLPQSPKITRVLSENMPSAVASLPEEAFVLLVTMGHSTDWPILHEILKTRTFPYLGVIGSRAKAVRLRKDVAAAGLPQACGDAFHCPIGLEIGNNHPEEIAISILAQLLQARG